MDDKTELTYHIASDIYSFLKKIGKEVNIEALQTVTKRSIYEYLGEKEIEEGYEDVDT